MAWSPPPLSMEQPDWLTFQVWWQQVIEDIQEQISGLEAALAAVAAAQAAAAAAQETATAVTAAQEHQSSYPTDATLAGVADGATAKITISAHVRRYPQPDGSLLSVNVSAGAVTGLAYATTYYVFYDDPDRTGGAVTYQALETAADATQTGIRHTVGAASTPATSGDTPTTGGQVRGAGVGTLSLALEAIE